MRTVIKCISCLILLATSPYMMRGQALPSLDVAEEFNIGTLPNGMSYYLVTNSSQKGFADFALVKNDGSSTDADRGVLDSLPHFGKRVPWKFLSDNGIGYNGEEGYIRHRSGATVFSFSGVPTYKRSVTDSTLLMLFDIAATSTKAQALVISGDFQVSEVKERMQLLSMMVPKLDENLWDSGYIWSPTDTLTLRTSINSTSNVVSVNVIYSSRRMPREWINTPQSLVTQAYAELLGSIVSKRIRETFASRGIPLSDVRFRYIGSNESAEDEHYIFSLFTSSDNILKATGVLSSVFASIDKEGVGYDELSDAKQRLVSEARRESAIRLSDNAVYVNRSIAAYLYGASLVGKNKAEEFIGRRALPKERELGFFNGFAAALLDSAANINIRYDIPFSLETDTDALKGTFNDTWAKTTHWEEAYKPEFGDTLSLFEPQGKVKLKVESTEPVSGGELWTFSNGIKVVYKQTTASSGEFHYALMLRGGIAMVPNLQEGEGAFVGDMLGLSDIAGLSGRDFKAMLETNGINMKETASVSDFRISGTAPNSKLSLLLRALLSIADKRTPGKEAFDYYKASERLRIDMESLSPRDVNSLMDSIMRPEYLYSERKHADNLRDDLPQRAEQYFATLFDKVNDGLIVIVGNLEEEALKKELCRTVGGFRTRKQFAQRPRISSRFASGSVTYTVESASGVIGGKEIGVNVALSAPLQYNMENYMAFRLAVAAIRKALASAITPYGAYAGIESRIEVFPSERMFLYINCKPCREEGLPLGISAADPLGLLDAVRDVSLSIGKTEISKEDLAAFKAELKNGFERELSDPEAIINNVLVRYSDGKDLVSGYKEAIESVSEDKITEILTALASGAEVEYVII